MGKNTKKDRKIKRLRKELEKMMELNDRMEDLLDILLDVDTEEVSQPGVTGDVTDRIPDCGEHDSDFRVDRMDDVEDNLPVKPERAKDKGRDVQDAANAGKDNIVPERKHTVLGRFFAAPLEELLTAIDELPDGIILEVYFDRA